MLSNTHTQPTNAAIPPEYHCIMVGANQRCSPGKETFSGKRAFTAGMGLLNPVPAILLVQVLVDQKCGLRIEK